MSAKLDVQLTAILVNLCSRRPEIMLLRDVIKE